MSNLSITLPNGIKLEGPADVVSKTLQTLNVKMDEIFPADKYYNSSSKGFTLISGMATEHLKNAVMKSISDYHTTLRKDTTLSGPDFVNALTDWSFISKPEFKSTAAMMRELGGR